MEHRREFAVGPFLQNQSIDWARQTESILFLIPFSLLLCLPLYEFLKMILFYSASVAALYMRSAAVRSSCF